jgi:hypothetical protein
MEDLVCAQRSKILYTSWNLIYSNGSMHSPQTAQIPRAKHIHHLDSREEESGLS